MDDYTNLRTIPALLSVVFVVATLYQFGGIATVEFLWVEDGYTLTTEHALFASLGAYLVAFASSETKDFDRYEDWEKVAIAAGPFVIVAHEYWAWFNDLIVGDGTSDLLSILAFLVVVTAWTVAVR